MKAGAPVVTTLALQIDCLERELRMRTAGYPGLISRGHMTQAHADRDIALMAAAIATLRLVQSRGMKAFKGTRPDRHALVLHFETEASRQDFMEIVAAAAPGAAMEVPT